MQTIDIVAELKLIARALSNVQIPFAVCGGFAMAVHGHPRATRDIDLLIEESHLEPAFLCLRQIGFTLRAGPIPFRVGTEKETRLFRATKVVGTSHLSVDLMMVTPIFKSIWKTRLRVDWEETPLEVVSREGLIEMKRIAGRDQDLVDVRTLEQAAAKL